LQAAISKGDREGKTMRKSGVLVAALLALLSLSACAPLLVGGAVAVVADEAIEQEKGGDGLF
jgi:putative component of membrane protein insertase Oxa1/YidC/SpoIIIJ protein YidD